MTGEVIKKFLVSLGFGVDDASFKKFTKFLDNSYVRVAALATAVKTAAAGIFAGFAKISEGFEEMGYQYRIIAPAINKAILLRRALLSAYKDAGINIVQAVQASVRFNFALAKTKFQLEGIVKSTAMKFLPTLTKQLDEFRKKVSANMPKILEGMRRFVTFIFKASAAITQLGVRLWSMLGRMWDLLERLDKVTNGWSTKILAVVAAWKLLNLAFLTTPIGMIITALIALLALYDDFMTWQEGGESLFDWGKWVPAINDVLAGFRSIWKVLQGMWEAIKLVYSGFKSIFSGNFMEGFKKWGEGLKVWLSQWLHIFDALKSAGNFFKNIGIGTMEASKGILGTDPVGVGGVNNTSSNMNQETNIYVNGSKDPQQTAKMISNEQRSVNFDIARNMKGAVR